MVDWKLYIDSPQKRALKLCYGSLTEANGYGSGFGFSNGSGFGCGYGWGSGGGCGGDHWDGGARAADGNGNGGSATKW